MANMALISNYLLFTLRLLADAIFSLPSACTLAFERPLKRYYSAERDLALAGLSP